MMAEQLYYSFVTDIGAAKSNNALLTGQMVKLTEFAVGDGAGGYYQPTPQQTDLRREVWRGQITGQAVDPQNPRLLSVSSLLPGEVGGFTIREMGLFDEQGDLFAVANLADVEKVTFESGMSSEIELTMHVIVENTQVTQVKIDPTVAIATKQDIIKHNASKDAHPGKADLAVLNAHAASAEIHTSADEKTAIADHIDNAELHVTAEEKAGWDGKAAPVQATSATLPASGWAKDTALAFWAQAVEIPGLLAGMRVGIGLTDAQQLDLADAGVNLRIDNDAGVAMAKAFGEQPSEDLTLQLFLTEVKL